MASKQTQKILLIVGAVVVLLVLLCAGGGYALYTVIRASTQEAEKVVEHFNASYNRQDYQAIYSSLHPDLQQSITPEKLAALLDYVHAKNGSFVSSSGTGWNVNSTNGVSVIVLGYSVKYARDSGSQEFTLIEVNGKPLIRRFQILSPNLAGYQEDAD